jgi:glycosyltransferase involved in cell wall biosynthesis
MLTENPKISIIIPAFNAERYLTRCLESAINQTFADWELIIADDGSTDKTGDIADKFAALDKRVRVIHLENCGVSSSRNTCLDRACGDYIFYLDADDYLEPDCLSVMIDQAYKYDADIVQCSSYIINYKGTKLSCVTSKNAVYNGQDEIMNAYFTGPIGEIKISVWAKLFKRKRFDDIRFDPEIKIYEDALYVYECCMSAGKICVINNPMYLYRQHENSVMHSFLNGEFRDYFFVFMRQASDFQNNIMFRKKIARRETETALWLMNCFTQVRISSQLWELRKIVLNSAGLVLCSSAPISLKVKVLGLASMPHVYFGLLRKRNSDK